MKRNLITLLSICLYASCFGQKLTGKITMFSENGDKFWLVLNGVKINQKADFRITAENLTEAQYKAKIIFQNEKLPPVSETIFIVDMDGNVYSKTLQIKSNKKGKYITRLVTAEILGNNNPPPPVVVPPKQDVIVPVVIPVPDDSPKQVVVPVVVPPNNGTPSNTVVDCGTPMNDADFNESLALVKGSSFSEEKRSAARQMCDYNCLSLNQVKILLSAFNFDDDKLETAKYAYKKCTEPKKYYLLKTAFMSSFTKEDFDTFLSKQK